MRLDLFAFVASLALVACAPQPSVTINGTPFEVTQYSTDLSAEGDVITLRFFSDPLPRAVDDEISIIVTLNLRDLNALQPQRPVTLGANAEDLVVGSFQYGCFCETDSTTPASTAGTLTLETFNEFSTSGALDLVLRGADVNGIELGKVVIQGDFEAKQVF